MVHTFLLTLVFLFFTPYFPCCMSLVGFFMCCLTVCFSMCGCAGGFLCYGSWFLYFTALVLLESLQQRKVSSAQQHEYDGSSLSFMVLQTLGFYFHCVHSLLCVPALLSGLGLHLASSMQFPSSCGPSHFCTILPAMDIHHPAPLNPHWLCSSPTIPVASMGISASFPCSFSLRRANPS